MDVSANGAKNLRLDQIIIIIDIIIVDNQQEDEEDPSQC
jgi:hypothetical protein